MNRFFLTFLLIMTIGIASFVVVRGRAYPVAFVNGTAITARQLEEEFDGVFSYYRASVKTYGGPEAEKAISTKKADEIQRSVLESLIEDVLITDELQVRHGKTLDAAIDAKIQENGGGDLARLQEAVGVLYGFTLDEFQSMILEPQARRELLEEQLIKEKQTLEVWLGAAKEEANVRVLNGYSWANGRVEL